MPWFSGPSPSSRQPSLGLPQGPSQCEFCHRFTLQGAWCEDCGARFAPTRARCRRCALPLGVASDRCGGCLADEPAFDAAVAAVDYGFPWNRLMASFKFQGRAELARPLAARLAQAVREQGEPALPSCLLPVPLSPQRLASRGYNQAWSLAQATAARLGLPAHAHWLQRPVDTPHQTGLTRSARQRNLARAFMVDPARRPALQGRCVALVDDVMTTGATLDAAARELKRVGVAAVQAWVFARTPSPAA